MSAGCHGDNCDIRDSSPASGECAHVAFILPYPAKNVLSNWWGNAEGGVLCSARSRFRRQQGVILPDVGQHSLHTVDNVLSKDGWEIGRGIVCRARLCGYNHLATCSCRKVRVRP